MQVHFSVLHLFLILVFCDGIKSPKSPKHVWDTHLGYLVALNELNFIWDWVLAITKVAYPVWETPDNI